VKQTHFVIDAAIVSRPSLKSTEGGHRFKSIVSRVKGSYSSQLHERDLIHSDYSGSSKIVKVAQYFEPIIRSENLSGNVILT